MAAAAAEQVPSFPGRHFDDRVGFVSAATAARLDATLRSYAAESGRQVYVSIFAELPSPSLEDFCIRTATAWRVGRKGLDDGVILFAFVRQRKLRIEVGYGLEDRIPDAIAKRIIEEHVSPRLAAGDVDGGFEAGVAAILAAAEGRSAPAPSPPAREASPASEPVAIPPAPPEPSNFGIVLDAIADIARREVGGLPVGIAFLIVAFPLLTSPILRLLPIRRRLRRGEPLPRAWLIESGILLWLILSNLRSGRGGSSYGGSASSSSGGGGRFGGGGASGSW